MVLPVGSHLLCFLLSTRQEHSETQLLRKRARDLDTEYKQLQLDYQGKDNRVLALEKEVEVTFVFHYHSLDDASCDVSFAVSCPHGCV